MKSTIKLTETTEIDFFIDLVYRVRKDFIRHVKNILLFLSNRTNLELIFNRVFQNL